MRATHRVKDSRNKTVGFIVDSRFYGQYAVRNGIQLIDNLSLTRNGVIRSKKELPEIQYRALNKLVYNRIKKNNPFKRDIQKELLAWKNDASHRVLQVEGPRQIGKTTEIKKFAYKNYEYVIYVNLSNDEFNFIETVTKSGTNPLNMEMYCRKAQLPSFKDSKQTLLIIDEIQISKTVYNSIRTLDENLNCDIIVTGSYLGKTLNKDYFPPAGTITKLCMFPLSFREFCRVFGKEDKLINLDIYNDKYDEEIGGLYEIYRQIGGYPEVIKTYLKDKSLKSCFYTMQRLLDVFEDESHQFYSDEKDPAIFKHVYECAVREMCREKRGSGANIVESIASIARNKEKLSLSKLEIRRAILWLEHSGIIGEMSLRSGDEVVQCRRIYFLDCGIANYMATLINTNESEREGFLTETFALCELHRLYKKPFPQLKVLEKSPSFGLYNDYELDFIVIEQIEGKNEKIYGGSIGIEVKTTKGDPKSLKKFIERGLIDRGILAQRTDGKRGEKYNTIPIYAIGTHFPYR